MQDERWRKRDGPPVGQQEDFIRLMNAHGAALRRLASSYARPGDDGEDLFQDISMAIWLALPRFRGESSERTFLFRIAHNRALSYLARRRLPATDCLDELDLRDNGPSPEAALASQQQGLRLLDAVRQLPVSYRQVVTLTLEGMSYAEIADVLGASETNVGVRLTRARHMLRRLLRGLA